MFQFSKTIDHHSTSSNHNEAYWPKGQTPEEYFAKWVKWFGKRGIKTEVRIEDGKCSLWREGTEAVEGYVKRYVKKEQNGQEARE